MKQKTKTRRSLSVGGSILFSLKCRLAPLPTALAISFVERAWGRGLQQQKEKLHLAAAAAAASLKIANRYNYRGVQSLRAADTAATKNFYHAAAATADLILGT